MSCWPSLLSGWVLVKVVVPEQVGKGGRERQEATRQVWEAEAGKVTEESAERKQTKAGEPEADKGMEQREQRIPRQGEKRERERQRKVSEQTSTRQGCPHRAMTVGAVTQACPALISPNSMAFKQEIWPLCALVSPGSLW